MALALCLEAALFWEYFSPPGCRKKRAAGRAAAAALLTRCNSGSQEHWDGRRSV